MDPGGNDDQKIRGPRINVGRSLGDVIEEVERLAKDLRRGLARTEALLWELYTMERALAEKDGPAPKRRASRLGAEPPGPAPTAHDCQYTVQEGGGGAVTFDNAKRVTLPPALAELIAILISSADESPDELVAWKSLDRVGELMQKRLGRAFSAHAISQLVWRLRGKLAEAGLDPRLVESSTASGVRLRLKRRAAGLCAG
jgi:hypothetical protein